MGWRVVETFTSEKSQLSFDEIQGGDIPILPEINKKTPENGCDLKDSVFFIFVDGFGDGFLFHCQTSSFQRHEQQH